MNNALTSGLEQIEGRQFQAAHASALELIRKDINDPVPYFLLGRIALDHNNFIKAKELLHRAHELVPSDPFFLAGYAQYFIKIGDHFKALDCADRAANLPIDNAFSADTIGVVYSRTGFHEKAIPFFELAVKLNPAPANFHYNLGASLQFSGNFEGAASAYEATIKRQASAYRAYSSLVSLAKQTPSQNHLPELESLYSQLKTDPDAALHLGHAIAKTLEDLDQYEQSFDWLVKAKNRKRKAIDYDLRSDLELFDAAAHTTGNKIDRQTSWSNASPIFIVGLPRTGTTLVDRILSSHPAVQSAGELNTFAGLVKTATGSSSNRVLDVATLNGSSKLNLAAIGHQYIKETARLTRGASRFTDKMPLNFFYAGLLHQALPEAKIIALRRGAKDSCLSNFRQLFSTGFSYYNYALDIDDTADYYKAFDTLMSHWRAHLPAERFMEVRYEDIVHDQENQTRTLLSFCDLDWNEACMNFHQNAAPVSTASSVQVRQPLYSGSIDRWKKYGNKLDAMCKRLGNIV